MAFQEEPVYLLVRRRYSRQTGVSQSAIVEGVVTITAAYSQIQLPEGVKIIGDHSLFEPVHLLRVGIVVLR